MIDYLAARLRQVREDRGLTLLQVAVKLGVSRTTVHRWEAESRPIKGGYRTLVEQWIVEEW